MSKDVTQKWWFNAVAGGIAGIIIAVILGLTMNQVGELLVKLPYIGDIFLQLCKNVNATCANLKDPDKNVTKIEKPDERKNFPVELKRTFAKSISELADVPPSDLHYAAIRNLVERYGVVKLYSDDTFRPNQVLTRSEFVDFLSSAIGTFRVYAKSKCRYRNFAFTQVNVDIPPDIAQDSWYYGSYKKMAQITGYSFTQGSNFQPDHGATRAEIAVGLNRTLDAYQVLLSESISNSSSICPSLGKYQVVRNEVPLSNRIILISYEQIISQVSSVSRFQDVKYSDWFFQDLQSLVERYGVMTGYSNMEFGPDRLITRSEFSNVLNDSLNILVELTDHVAADHCK